MTHLDTVILLIEVGVIAAAAMFGGRWPR